MNVRTICETFTGDFQVVVIKRYDGAGLVAGTEGLYTTAVTTWPVTEDEDGEETTSFRGFVDKDMFCGDLIANGFTSHPFTSVDPEFQEFITCHILPIEWHNCMDEAADRVEIFTR